ncbi:hypothetical protein DFH28DRAFT_911610, partial [Melampsora americana]
MNEDAAIASDLTGQSGTLTLTPRPPSGLQKATITQEVIVGSISATSTPADKSRKRTRTTAPTPSTLDEVEEITGTPRSTCIAKLFPGGSGVASKPLNVLIERLIEVLKATLIPKSKLSKSVKVDVDSAAGILLLAGLVQEQASINEARRVVFEPCRQTALNPSPSSAAATAQFEFRNNTLADKVVAMAEQLEKLVTATESSHQLGQQHPQQKAKGSYALAASKHAPGAGVASLPNQQGFHAQSKHTGTGSSQGPRAHTQQAPRPKAEHSITLSQKDPANIAGADMTIAELIKQFNGVLKEKNIKQTLNDKSSIVVRNIHRHPSKDLVVYLES